MADPQSAAPDGGAPPPPRAAGLKEKRHPILWALLWIGGVIGAVISGLALASVLQALLSPLVAWIVSTLLALVLPFILGLRAAAALKRKGRGVVLRRVLALFLVTAAQLALFGAILQFSSKTTGDLAATGFRALEQVGGVPLVSGVLEKLAREAGKLDAKPQDGTPAVPGAALSARTAGGRTARSVGVSVVDETGDPALVVFSISGGGAWSAHTVDLAAHAALGPVTGVDVADDGGAVVTVAASTLLRTWPNQQVVDVLKGVARGARLGAFEVRGIKDAVAGNGGVVVAVVETTAQGQVGEALVLIPATGAPQVLRARGEAIPDAPENSVSHSFELRRSGSGNGLIVVEQFLEGGDAVAQAISGSSYTMNPERLLVGTFDQPRALVEVARTGQVVQGLAEAFSLQAFADVGVTADGRALFDANWVENGPYGWLLQASSSGGVAAVWPEQFAQPSSPWSMAAPRLKHLDVTPEGAFAFVDGQGQLVTADVARAPGDAQKSLKGAVAWRADGKRVGDVVNVLVPAIARGGAFVVASVDLLAEGGVKRRALMLTSADDRQKGVGEVLLVEGGPLPKATPAPAPVAPDPKAKAASPPPAPSPPPATAPERVVRSLRFGDFRSEPLWTPPPPGGVVPTAAGPLGGLTPPATPLPPVPAPTPAADAGPTQP